MKCAKHNVRGVDSDNQCEKCEDEPPPCWTCVNYRTEGVTGEGFVQYCELEHDLKPCKDYLREVGSEG